MHSNQVKILGTLILFIIKCTSDELQLVYQWNQISAPKLDRDEPPKNNETFYAYGNLPMGVAHHKGRLFLTFPRRRPGTPYTLAVINMNTVRDVNNPPMTGYPEPIVNTLHLDYAADSKRIVSVYRARVDKCDRLWFVDTGYLEYPGNKRQVQRPSLWVINLSTDRRIQRFEIPAEIVELGYGMASVTVDVEPDKCDEAYAYIPDYEWQGLYVYSLSQNRMWRFKHIFFSFEPQYGNFNVAGIRFVWNDGLFSVAIGNTDSVTGNRMVYLHAMAAVGEIAVSNSVLKNETLAHSGDDYNQLFKHLGSRGPNTQSSSHTFDESTGVLFYAEVNRNSIGCWNSKQKFDADNHGIVHLDNSNMIYPADLTIDNEGVIWVISNKLPIWIYSKLNVTDFNYHIWRQTAETAIDGTICM
ncbi:L-dopachrome tautomerase yellow-f-like isoform X2 [Malaya genurostris]|uniref:L-dopachrome tautomerase yellow-f-like isoform X2 n=1 Tax=Malaya genurostris TaxID=325434 RepID=UPI0026F39011|nr:L-dopachrome tautomerase yellow-f-like isoform X2 [Malaya genurostris]